MYSKVSNPKELFDLFLKSEKSGNIYLSTGSSLSYGELFSRTKETENQMHTSKAEVVINKQEDVLLISLLRAWSLGRAAVLVPDSLKKEYIYTPNKFITDVPEDVALVIFSSGTTGKPKPIPITAQAVFNAANISVELQKIKHDSKILASISSIHSGGIFLQLLPAIYVGCDIYFGSQPISIYELNKKYTHTVLVPPQVERLRRSVDWSTLNLEHFDYIVTGSSNATRAVKFLLDRKARVINIYGTSETCTVNCYHIFSMDDKIEDSPVSCGFSSVDGKIYIEDKKVVIEGPTVPKYVWAEGKYKKTNETKFVTSDIGEITDKGLVLRGRIDGLIRCGAISFFPEEVERIIMEFPDVIECKVVGVKHKILGEVAVAWVYSAKKTKSALLRSFCVNKIGRERSPFKVHWLNEPIKKSALEKMIRYGFS
ncbi:MAG: long-chain fatty acid--CoA ligase [Oligoflexia bacterium]|nr:long-chain fatty acid--CoA ligase [Oligoflexia bacterium]